jgi:hypothetical protein
MYNEIFKGLLITNAIAYAILSATTKIFYTNKNISELSTAEKDILFDRAKFRTKIGVFFINLIGGFITPQIYIIAGLITFFIYLVKLII